MRVFLDCSQILCEVWQGWRAGWIGVSKWWMAVDVFAGGKVSTGKGFYGEKTLAKTNRQTQFKPSSG